MSAFGADTALCDLYTDPVYAVNRDAGANLQIWNLQQSAVADPGSGKFSIGLARCSRVAARFMQFRQSVVRPAIGRSSAERTLELSLCLSIATSLQQGSGERLPDRVIPIRRLSI